MKKFRMMLPMLAVVFAVGGAAAGSLFAPITAYRVSTSGCVSGTTEQQDCKASSDENYPLCTIKVGSLHPQAFLNNDCSGILRNVPQP